MPVTLSKIASNAAKVTFKYGEDDVTVEYFPARITERTFAQLQAFSKVESTDDVIDSFIALNELLAGAPVDREAIKEGERPRPKPPIIKSWDVLNDDGSMFPIRPDRFPELPIVFRLAVLRAILGDIRPNQEAAKEI